MILRPMLANDIQAGLSLCRAIGWNQLSADWELFLKLSPEGCRVALDEIHKVIGTVTTVRYQDHFSWIGMVLVDPSRQRQGTGIQLLNEALAILADEKTVKLDATPAGREVYLKLGFREEYPLTRMRWSPENAGLLRVNRARQIEKDDLQKIALFDLDVFGADRRVILNDLWQRDPEMCFVVEEGNDVRGYCLGRRGYTYLHLGPVIAHNVSDATDLASAALLACSRKPVITDVLHHSEEWIAWLSAAGFSELRPLTRMFRGANAWPGLPEKQFAILGPEFG